MGTTLRGQGNAVPRPSRQFSATPEILHCKIAVLAARQAIKLCMKLRQQQRGLDLLQVVRVVQEHLRAGRVDRHAAKPVHVNQRQVVQRICIPKRRTLGEVLPASPQPPQDWAAAESAAEWSRVKARLAFLTQGKCWESGAHSKVQL